MIDTKLIKNENFIDNNGQYFYHQSNYKNIKSIFENGLISGKEVGWERDPDYVWAWDVSLEKMMEQYSGKQALIVIKTEKKFKPTESPAVMFKDIPPSDIYGIIVPSKRYYRVKNILKENMKKLVRESLIVEKQRLQLSAGLVIIQDGTILLAHPKGAKWHGTFSIPKGHVEEGEDLLEAAIRETREEVDINISPNDVVSRDANFIDYTDKEGNVYKRVYYFIVHPKEEIKGPSWKPENSEVDWAGFLNKEKASQRIFWRLKPILDYIEDPEENTETKE